MTDDVNGPPEPAALPTDDVASLIARFRRSPLTERTDIAMTLARRFEPVIQRTWTLHAKDRLEYADFVEKVLDELFADVEHLRSARAFPFLFMTILQRVVDNASSTGAGLVSPPQPDSGQRSTGLDPAIVDVLLVQAYIDRLAPRTRMALELEFVEGLSREEIMERMELTLSGVVTARKRGLQTLRVILQKEAKGLRSAERYTRKPRQR